MKYIYIRVWNYGTVVSVLDCELRDRWFGTRGRQIFYFLKICFWSVNGDPVLRICHRPVWQSVKVFHSKQFTDSQKQICNRPETESVCYLGRGNLLSKESKLHQIQRFLAQENIFELCFSMKVNDWLVLQCAKLLIKVNCTKLFFISPHCLFAFTNFSFSSETLSSSSSSSLFSRLLFSFK